MSYLLKRDIHLYKYTYKSLKSHYIYRNLSNVSKSIVTLNLSSEHVSKISNFDGDLTHGLDSYVADLSGKLGYKVNRSLPTLFGSALLLKSNNNLIFVIRFMNINRGSLDKKSKNNLNNKLNAPFIKKSN